MWFDARVLKTSAFRAVYENVIRSFKKKAYFKLAVHRYQYCSILSHIVKTLHCGLFYFITCLLVEKCRRRLVSAASVYLGAAELDSSFLN